MYSIQINCFFKNIEIISLLSCLLIQNKINPQRDLQSTFYTQLLTENLSSLTSDIYLGLQIARQEHVLVKLQYHLSIF